MSSQKSLKEIVKEEYSRCYQDPVYFLKKFCTIQHPTRGRIRFNLYPFQENVLNQFQNNKYNIVLKSRQLGLSTLTAGFILHQMIFRNDFLVLVIATRQDTARNLVTKVKIMYEGLPSWLKVGKVDEDSKLSLRFPNGSNVKAISSRPDAARSEALSLLVLDEAAFIKDVDKIWGSAQQTLATGGSAIILSTPNGIGNFFHSEWVKAEQGESKFNPIKLHWTVHPERDQKWRDEQTLLVGAATAAAECDASFIASGNSVIDLELIEWYRQTYVEEPLERRGFDANYYIWDYPDYSKTYIVAADVSRGDSSDNSTFHVLDLETLAQVAEYKGKIDTTQFGHMLISAATDYNYALLVIDNSNVGWATIQVVLDANYSNLYYTYREDPYLDSNIHLKKGYDVKDKSKMTPGFTVSTGVRPLIVSKIEAILRQIRPAIRSSRVLDELTTFSWINGKAQAQQGYNDDLVMALGIGFWVKDMSLKLKQHGIDIAKQSIENISRTVYTTSPGLRSRHWEQPLGRERESLTWLLK